MSRIKRKKQNILPARYILLIFTVVCFFLLMGSFLFNWTSGPVGTAASYVFIPMQKGMTCVGNWISDKATELVSLKNVMQENEQLQAKVDQLTEELNTLKLERYDTEALRKLMALDDKYSNYNKVAASVISKDAGNWFETFLIDKGSKDGIQVGMNVIADSGLVGIITYVGPNYSKVRSIIDDNCNVSGMVLSTSDNCIVSGNLEKMDSSQMILFSNLRDSKDAVAVGDQVVTSYISSQYVQGLLIGYISEINENSNNLTKSGTITPVVDFEHLKHVLIITDMKTEIEEEE